MQVFICLFRKNSIHILEFTLVICLIVVITCCLKLFESFYKIATIICDSSLDFVFNVVSHVNLMYLGSNNVICVCLESLLESLISSPLIQWQVIPKKLLLEAVQISAVVDTECTLPSFAWSSSLMCVYALSSLDISVFWVITVFPLLMPSISFLNACCSYKENDWSAFIMKLRTRVFSLVLEILSTNCSSLAWFACGSPWVCWSALLGPVSALCVLFVNFPACFLWLCESWDWLWKVTLSRVRRQTPCSLQGNQQSQV